MSESGAEVWQSPELAAKFLGRVRAAIPLAAEQIDTLLRLAAGLPRVQRVLDLGCGDGVLGRALAARFGAEVAFVDFSSPMLTAARQAWGDRPGATFHCADLGDAGWPVLVAPPPYDVVVSGFCIHHLPHRRKQLLYSEILDALAPGGLFVNVEHVASASEWGQGVFDELFVDRLWAAQGPRVAGSTREAVAAEYYHRPDKVANLLAPVETQLEWLRALGYEDVDCWFKIFELALFGGRRAGAA